jgi:hypothetical protein
MVTSLLELQALWSFVTECVETNDFLAIPSTSERLNLPPLDPTQVDQARELLELQRHLMVRLEEAGVGVQRELDFLHTLEESSQEPSAQFIDASL